MKRSNNAAEHKGLLFTGISALLFLSTFLTGISRAQTIVYADLVLTHADRNENRETININSKGRISENEAKD